MARMQTKSDLNLLLIGNTGNGKSATGNMILNKKHFHSSGNANSVTKTTSVGECRPEDGRRIRVVDTPGVCDPESDDFISTQITRVMTNAMKQCDTGYHAVLLVFRFGVLSKDNRDIIKTLLKIFGENFMKDYCIIIVTHGDNFETEKDESGEIFEDWCRRQGTYFQDLLERCGNRILLFDNMTKDQSKLDSQRQQLTDMAIEFQLSHGTRLTKQRYESAQRWACPVL